MAFHQLRFGSHHRFIEGYGPVLRNGELPFSRADFDAEGKLLPEDKREQAAEGINVIIKSEDDDYEFDVEEITN
ncbi:hypothetical protein ACRQ5D_10755 [Mucilaginibacter sp. P25]|uniref:hypothetical protein n=1 Tax=Mucilaginibacter sp. P25 TaxID=3423945 RepID=UPI003D798BEA